MTALFRTLPKIYSDDGLNKYLQEIRKYPLLEFEYEVDLAKKWEKTKYLILSGIFVTLLLLLMVVYKNDEKITKKSELIENSNVVTDLKT